MKRKPLNTKADAVTLKETVSASEFLSRTLEQGNKTGPRREFRLPRAKLILLLAWHARSLGRATEAKLTC